jgi:integrase/recombinase XerD
MHHHAVSRCSVSEFCSEYDDHLDRLRGLSVSTRRLHRYVVRRFLTLQFRKGTIDWNKIRFDDVVDFLKKEFARLSSRDTQRVWLMILRSVLRYLAESGRIPQGWDAALPKITSYSQARLPKNLTSEQVQALFFACRGKKRRHARYRALLLLCLRLGLRVQEVANLAPGDIDWKNGCLRVRCTKTYSDRLLPFPQDVGMHSSLICAIAGSILQGYLSRCDRRAVQNAVTFTYSTPSDISSGSQE